MRHAGWLACDCFRPRGPSPLQKKTLSLAVWLCSRENDSEIYFFLDKGVPARCRRPGRGFIYPTTLCIRSKKCGSHMDPFFFKKKNSKPLRQPMETDMRANGLICGVVIGFFVLPRLLRYSSHHRILTLKPLRCGIWFV